MDVQPKTLLTMTQAIRSLGVAQRVYLTGKIGSIRVACSTEGASLNRRFICNARDQGAWVERIA